MTRHVMTIPRSRIEIHDRDGLQVIIEGNRKTVMQEFADWVRDHYTETTGDYDPDPRDFMVIRAYFNSRGAAMNGERAILYRFNRRDEWAKEITWG